MRNRTVQLLLLAGLLLTPLVGLTQNAEIHFTYDACGNRIVKSLQLKMIEENGKYVEDRNAFLATASETIQDTEIGIYPNPTKGKIILTVSQGLSVPLESVLTMATGVVIESHRFQDRQHEFDLSQQPAGIYILKLILADETRTWKIVKH